MNLCNELIKEYLNLSEMEFKDSNDFYDEHTKKMNKVDLNKITKDDVKDIIKPFLIDWGRMGRVLGRKEFKGWEENLIHKIRLYSKKLNCLKTKELMNTDLETLKPEIKEIYNSFYKVIGSTATAKTLHLICPNFFPLWDTQIRNATDLKDSNENYLKLMQISQNLLTEYLLLHTLSKQYKRGALKLLDEFLWLITQDPLYLFLKKKK